MQSPNLDSLYRELILDHSRSPRNTKATKNPSARAEGYNPLCGDRVSLEIQVDSKGRIEDVCILGKGCSISVSAGSMLSEELRGKTLEEARKIIEGFRAMMRGECTFKSENGEMESLEGVREFPIRIKCALLPFSALDQALGDVGSAKKLGDHQ